MSDDDFDLSRVLSNYFKDATGVQIQILAAFLYGARISATPEESGVNHDSIGTD